MCATLGISGARADSIFTFKPTLDSRQLANDNRRMRTEGATGIFASITNFRLPTNWEAERSEINIRPTFRLSRYTNETAFNAEDYFVSADGEHRFENTTIGLNFDFD